jgi:methyl-accepting chemotaxis protein
MFQKIVDNNEHTSNLIPQVAVALREQTGGSQQIQAALAQLNQLTQENTAMIEEITSSGYALSEEAKALEELANEHTEID